VGSNLERCLYCASTDIVRAGRRYKQHEILQRWSCHSCAVSFSPRTAGKGSTYPLKVILETLCRFYQGYTIGSTADYIRGRFGLTIHSRTISRWLTAYRPLSTFARLRDKTRHTHSPHRLIRSTRLHPKQVYAYRIHQGKLDHILNTREHQTFQPIADYLTDMAENCPHHLFQNSGNTGSRASQGKVAFNLDAVEVKAKRNQACRMAELVLQTVTINKRRHDEIQRFMLIVDSVTVAVEVPIILTPEDIAHMQHQLGFQIPIETNTTLTGHIDVLQIRNGKIHILDYKPGATKEKTITQLMVYALALSRRTGLRLYDFVCAWFDEHHYFEFYPLHVVHKRRR
jgi:transposase-like protein